MPTILIPEIAPEVVVFDFDGTLVSRDSFTDFALRFCRRRVVRSFFVLALLPVAAISALRSSTLAGSILLWAMTLGVSPRRLALELRRYGREQLPRHANEAVFAELERHLREGSRVVIATGTLPLLVRCLLRARELPATSIVGSRLRRKWGGFIADTHCVGRRKVRELERRLGITSWVSVYSDSFVDRSLFGRARHVTLVSPSRRTLLRVRRTLDESIALRIVEPSAWR